MVSNQEKVMIIRKKSVANPVKSRFAKKSQKISTHLLTVLTISDILSVTSTLLFIYVAVKYILYLYN